MVRDPPLDPTELACFDSQVSRVLLKPILYLLVRILMVLVGALRRCVVILRLNTLAGP